METPQLLARCRSGSARAAHELFDICWPVVWRTAYRVVGERGLAEDAAQIAIVNVFRSLDLFDEQRPLEPWVARITINAALNEMRREARQVPHREGVTYADVVAEPAFDDFSHSSIRSAVAALPTDHRITVVLHYWLDYSVSEIAEITGIPNGTVASRLSRALSSLRESLEGEDARSPS